MTKGFLSYLKRELMDFLFPPFCVTCNQAGEWWCQACRQSVQRLSFKPCPKCLALDSHVCVGDLPFDQVTAFGYYHDPKLRAAITALKFQGTTALTKALKSFLMDRAHALSGLAAAAAALVPMPLSEKRLKERGFNQAELIAQSVQQTLLPQVSVSDCLTRRGHRDPQSSVAHDLATRQANVFGCFKVVGQVPRRVILVDDVVTTGATAAEAARVLLASGAEKVSILALVIGV